MDVRAGPNGLGYGRLGMIVPKRLVVSAVKRNRIKRLIRECFRQRQSELAGLDIIARLRASATDHPADETRLRDDFLKGMAACRACVRGRRHHPNDTE